MEILLFLGSGWRSAKVFLMGKGSFRIIVYLKMWKNILIYREGAYCEVIMISTYLKQGISVS